MPRVTLGLIADTHDLVRPEVAPALQGVEHILHAGDVCTPGVLEELGRLAPVTAVRGNNDIGAWAQTLPEATTIELAGLRIHLRHIAQDVDVDCRAEGIDVVLCGHSHRPKSYEKDGALWIDPGSAGPPRFSLPIQLARLEVEAGQRPKLVTVPLVRR